MRAVLLAQRINRLCGGAVIAPWEIEELPYTWLDALTGMTDELPKMKESRAEVQRVIAELKKKSKR